MSKNCGYDGKVWLAYTCQCIVLSWQNFGNCLLGFRMAVNGLTAAHLRGSQGGKSMQLRFDAGTSREVRCYRVVHPACLRMKMNRSSHGRTNVWGYGALWRQAGFLMHLRLTFHPYTFAIAHLAVFPGLNVCFTTVCTSWHKLCMQHWGNNSFAAEPYFLKLGCVTWTMPRNSNAIEDSGSNAPEDAKLNTASHCSWCAF